MIQAYTASKIFTGSAYLTGHAILVNDRVITGLVPITELPGDVAMTDYGKGLKTAYNSRFAAIWGGQANH